MDLSAIKSRLEQMNTSGNREKIDYDAIFWKPTTGKHQIRIVPSAYDPTFPFSEIKFHYGIGKYPMIALSNYGKQDPIEEFCKKLRETSDKDNWSLAGKLSPKTRIFAPVIVRGEEDKGVRLWGFGKMIYKALLSLAEDEDVGDFTDVTNGFDMIVEQVQGNPYPETTVRIKPRMSPLSDDPTLVEKWVKEQPNPTESFPQYDYDFMKERLQEYLDPDSVSNSDDEEESQASTSNSSTGGPVEAASTPAPAPAKSNFTLENATEGKKDVVSKFDDLFS